MINYKSEIENSDLSKLCDLYKSAGWWDEPCSPEQISLLISNSFYFLTAWDDDKLVAMGRVISDAFSDAYIQDVFVKENYRKQGIAGILVGRLRDYCLGNNIHWIGLIAAPGSAGLYEHLGFEKMIDHTPMLLKKKAD
jgi:aralkylamine N-acetyltransferase